MALTGFALAAALLISVDVARAAPASATPAPHRQEAVVLSSHEVQGQGEVSRLAAGSTRHGCPYGDACMYTTSGWNNNNPEHEYYSYGCYNLSNEYGTRVIYNNQYGGAKIAGYGSYGCGAVNWVVGQGGWLTVNITPINSVRLYS
jgi:hypothetical protein